MFDHWTFDSHEDHRRCELCGYYQMAPLWNGDQLRTEFPNHEVVDDNTIDAFVHPNCRCQLLRVIEV